MAFYAMCKTIIGSLFQKSATITYPMAPKANPPTVRGHVAIDIESCIYCGLCQRKCPTGAINVSKPEAAWGIERFACIQCGCCVEVCPKKCLRMDDRLSKCAYEKTRDVVANARVPAGTVDHTDS